MENSKLFVGNLPFKTSEDQLSQLFGEHGTVKETYVPLDRATGRPRGFAFVTMGTAEEAQKAIDGLNEKNFEGRDITVNIAKPRTDRN